MSALNGSPMKKSEKRMGPSIEDIGSNNGIAVGRGYEDRIATQAVQAECETPVAMALPMAAPSMEQLSQFIDNSALPEESKEATKSTLQDKLVTELQKGNEANVAVVKAQVTEITERLPDIRYQLRSFIENYAGISKTIRLVTHKLLD